MSILEGPRLLRDVHIAAVVEQSIEVGCLFKGVRAHVNKHPVVILVSEGGSTRAIKADGEPMPLATFEHLFPGSLESFEASSRRHRTSR
jgi:hypothetical protein